ncbi:nuclear transport factor 2 family protein [Sediminitomix flava]|uniref:SnoaL-like domain-containing protein n=1 Tax=Sediminitomix flava TaxID=379075 RepID=A0A315Z8B2_SEDFL|nr:nuclear transport factor 2 family protein [Sediminitomix flava]PWJ41816.1 hypothetical protein BC781_10366 [Sediminitomix flava]
MSLESNKQIVQEFFRQFENADVGAALDCLTDDVQWLAMGVKGDLPISGEMDKDGIGNLIQLVDQTFPEGLKLTFKTLTAEEDRVAAEVVSYGEKANGTVYNNLYHYLFKVKNGKVSLVKEYFDTIHVKAVFIDDK